MNDSMASANPTPDVVKQIRRRGLLGTLLCFEGVAILSGLTTWMVGLGGYLPVFVAFDVVVFAPFSALISGGAVYGINQFFEGRSHRLGRILGALAGMILAGLLWAIRVEDTWSFPEYRLVFVIVVSAAIVLPAVVYVVWPPGSGRGPKWRGSFGGA
ncbi:hypothetical protein ACFVWR_07745 [Leifsonia sp. NPDC058292]|uniref:hypothetical protein n=1 Tax=Leifsonia sp. NPDC058292 TaxID=3346428 RepID=UPI0036DCB8C5